MKRRRVLLGFGITLAVAIVAITLSAGYGRWVMKDAAGLTRATVNEQSLETQYQRLGEHFEMLWRETEQLQRLVHENEWDYNDAGRVMPGNYSPRFGLTVMKSKSYFLQTQKGFDLPGGKSQIESMVLGLDELGYSYTQAGPDASGTTRAVRVELPSGGSALYREHVNGRGLLDVFSGMYWGDDRELGNERANRPYQRPPDVRGPGQNPEFPAWDAPKR